MRQQRAFLWLLAMAWLLTCIPLGYAAVQVDSEDGTAALLVEVSQCDDIWAGHLGVQVQGRLTINGHVHCPAELVKVSSDESPFVIDNRAGDKKGWYMYLL